MDSHSRKVTIIVSLAAIALALVSCADFKAPGLESVEISLELQTGESVLVDVVNSSNQISAFVGELRAQCMKDQKFPQIAEAHSMKRPAEGRYQRAPLSVERIESGPSTIEEAKEFGFVGLRNAWDEGSAGSVIANNSEYERAWRECDDWIYGDVAENLSVIQQEIVEFANEIEVKFINLVHESTTDYLLKRVSCTAKNGYPRFTSRIALESRSFEDLLRRLSIPQGEYGLVTKVPDRELLAKDEIKVIEPQKLVTYVPSSEEIAFAVVYVECAVKTDFFEQSERAIAEAKVIVEKQFASRAQTLWNEIQNEISQISENLKSS